MGRGDYPRLARRQRGRRPGRTALGRDDLRSRADAGGEIAAPEDSGRRQAAGVRPGDRILRLPRQQSQVHDAARPGQREVPVDCQQSGADRHSARDGGFSGDHAPAPEASVSPAEFRYAGRVRRPVALAQGQDAGAGRHRVDAAGFDPADRLSIHRLDHRRRRPDLRGANRLSRGAELPRTRTRFCSASRRISGRCCKCGI